MRRFLSILRKPTVLLAPVFFASFAFFYWLGEMRSWSKYEFDTDVIFVSGSPGGWRHAKIYALANDGSKAIVITEQTVSMPTYVTQVFETNTGKNTTPDPDPKREPTYEFGGVPLRTDEAACRAFPRYFSHLRESTLAEWQKKVSPEDSQLDLDLILCGSSSDGRFYFYGTDNGMPCHGNPLPPLELINVN